jgi:hypothetical protein
VWARIAAAPCHGALLEFQRRWVALFGAVALRDATRMAELASGLLATQSELGSDAREYLLMAGMAGYLAADAPQHARTLWGYYAERIPRAASRPLFRLLRCHAEPGDQAACAAAFARYADER